MPTIDQLAGAQQQAVTIAQAAYTTAVTSGQPTLAISSKGLDGSPGCAAAYDAWLLLIAVGALDTPFVPSPSVPNGELEPRQVALIDATWTPGYVVDDVPVTLSTMQANLLTALLAQF